LGTWRERQNDYLLEGLLAESMELHEKSNYSAAIWVVGVFGIVVQLKR
jgi:hypothetical protein